MLGDWGASINSVTGIIDSEGVNFNNEIFVKHPDSGIEFKGFKIPMWDDALSLFEEVSLINTINKFVAWDIVITDNGVDIIEGNSRGCRHFLQAIDKIGKKEIFENFYRRVK